MSLSFTPGFSPVPQSQITTQPLQRLGFRAEQSLRAERKRGGGELAAAERGGIHGRMKDRAVPQSEDGIGRPGSTRRIGASRLLRVRAGTSTLVIAVRAAVAYNIAL